MHVRMFGAVNFRKEKKCIWKEYIAKMTTVVVGVLYCSPFNCDISTIFFCSSLSFFSRSAFQA